MYYLIVTVTKEEYQEFLVKSDTALDALLKFKETYPDLVTVSASPTNISEVI